MCGSWAAMAACGFLQLFCFCPPCVKKEGFTTFTLLFLDFLLKYLFLSGSCLPLRYNLSNCERSEQLRSSFLLFIFFSKGVSKGDFCSLFVFLFLRISPLTPPLHCNPQPAHPSSARQQHCEDCGVHGIFLSSLHQTFSFQDTGIRFGQSSSHRIYW